MKTPIKCASVGVAVNIVLNLSLVGKMAHGGLALATSHSGACKFCAAPCISRQKAQRGGNIEIKEQGVKDMRCSGGSCCGSVWYTLLYQRGGVYAENFVSRNCCACSMRYIYITACSI